MTDFAQRLFEDDKATPLFLGRWRAKGAAKPLSANLQLTHRGEATNEFRSLWASAFPTRAALPQGQLHLTDGTITVAFHRVWR